MKTSDSYRDEPGRNSRDAHSSERNRNSNERDRDNERLFPEDRKYYNSYDRNNRKNYEPDYNAYDRSHSPYDRDRERYGYNRRFEGRSDNRATFNEDQNYRYEGYDRSEGYRGRDSGDYDHHAPYWSDYYDAADNHSRHDGHGYTYRVDEDYERERLNPGPKGHYSWGRVDEDQSKGSYGYYESYPSYGQSESYSDHERYSGKTGDYKTPTDEYGETDSENKRKNIRDRRFW